MTAFIWQWDVFFGVVLALLAITLVVLGILTAYFGSGKSRAVGVVLLVVGLVVGIITIFTKNLIGLNSGILQTIVIPTFFYVIASVVGVAIGLLIFLGAIMKT
jgi:hypothetical protein